MPHKAHGTALWRETHPLGLVILPNNTSGYVSAIVIGGRSKKGTEARPHLDCVPPILEVKYENGTFTFSIKGYGYGVGMSQVGAEYMANRGYFL